MGKLSFFDRIAIGTIAGAAVIQALQQAFKDAPSVTRVIPALSLDGAWNYVPLGLLVVGLFAWLFGLGRGSAVERPDSPFAKGVIEALKTANVPPPAEPESERIFLHPSLTPESIFASLAGKTTYQSNKLSETYVGKWMKIRGRFADLDGGMFGTHSIDLQDRSSPYSKTYHGLISNFIASEWLQRLEILHSGQEICYIGRVSRVTQRCITLSNCELLPEEKWSGATPLGYPPEVSPKTNSTAKNSKTIPADTKSSKRVQAKKKPSKPPSATPSTP